MNGPPAGGGPRRRKHTVGAPVTAAACLGVALVCALSAGCRSGEQVITGAGATAPFPLYSRWTSEYARLHPEVRINYVSLGSGAGIRQVSERVIDFGASDIPLSAEQEHESGVRLVELPVLLGAVVPVYSLPGIGPGVRLSPEVLAAVYLGDLTRWDDPRLAADNPGVRLPAEAIVPVYRSDGAGTTALFTQYLSQHSAAFRQKVGSGTSVRWPVGVGAKGSEGVAGVLRQQPYSLGYVEQVYATESGLPAAVVRNETGAWVSATLASLQAAAAGDAELKTHAPPAVRTQPAIPMPPAIPTPPAAPPSPGVQAGLLAGNAPGAYPIAGYTSLLLPVGSPDTRRSRELGGFIAWVLDHGEAEAAAGGYAPLPSSVQEYAHRQLAAWESAG